MRDNEEKGIYKTFRISITLTVALCLAGIFLGMNVRTRGLIDDEILEDARAQFATIVLARQWNASYGGVYVEKKDGVQSTPYINNPDITTADGRTFTIRTPAMMTREISELTRKGREFSYHITSLKPLNPANAPDESERRALVSFESGKKEAYWEEEIDGVPFMRYMAPLRTEKLCLQCHAAQGYKVGDIRGGISVNIPIGTIRKKLFENALQILAFAALATALLLGLVWFFTRRLIRKVSESRRTIEVLATTDALTGCFNRGHILERFTEELLRAERTGHGFCVIMFDLDHFKLINDALGHQAGDEVLRETVRRSSMMLRPYDLIGRYGGEEFLVLLPESSAEDAMRISERVRAAIEAEPFGPMAIRVTISSGVSCIRAEGESVDRMLYRADSALYEAKAAGRNRTVYKG